MHRTLDTLISTPDMWGMPELLELSMQEYRDGQCAPARLLPIHDSRRHVAMT